MTVSRGFPGFWFDEAPVLVRRPWDFTDRRGVDFKRDVCAVFCW